MTWYLDSNICIDCLRGKTPFVKEMLQSLSPLQIKIPSMVKAELIHGAYKSAKPEQNTELVKKFLLPFEIIAFDDAATGFYGQIRSSLERKGMIIGFNDLIIASTVLAGNGCLVSANINEFKRIDGLKLENWVEIQ